MTNKNQINSWSDVIQRLRSTGSEQRVSVHRHVNSCCVKCDKIEKEMIRTGSVIFCIKCFFEEFETTDPVTDERDKYRKWLRVYMEKIDV